MRDLRGQTFNQLKAIEPTEQRTKNGNVIWKCECLLCGGFCYISSRSLTKGFAKNCGQHTKEAYPRKHGDAIGGKRNRLLNIYSLMLARCYNPKNNMYKYYGGKGIIVCDEWKNNYLSFKEWSLQNGYSDCFSIDRINPNGNYSPENCRWVTAFTQNNNKEKIKKYSFNGEKHSVAEWARKIGISRECLKCRIKNGWTIEKALTTPPKENNKIKTSNLSGLQLRCFSNKWCVCDGRSPNNEETGYYIGTQLSRWFDTWKEANECRLAIYNAISQELRDAAVEFENQAYEIASKHIDTKYNL